MHNRPSGTVTFLFTDIEGSTQLWEQFPEGMKTAYARQESILRQAAAAHGGYAYKMIGDAFQIAFDTAPEAVFTALEAQRALHAETWPETGPVRVRMALHTGVTEERSDDYVGPVLNRVARLLAVAHGGQVLLTQPTFDLVRDDLPYDINLRDLGEHRLKDLVRPERIYQLIATDLPFDRSPLQTLDTFPHNLPVQVTSFIGREKEIKEIKRLLWESRLVTLTGPGGTGKSRLSLQIAAEFLELYPDGAWLVELAPITDPALLPQTVANALGVREAPGRPMLKLLTDYLRTKELLLILDNCEHLVDACAQLVDSLLRTSANILILASSREALGISGEASYRVPSLSTPDPRHLPPLEALTQFEAVQLFIERAEMVLPGFTVTNDNAPAVAQICHRLDGIPLAIELAAARVGVLRVEQIATRLDNRFRLLTGGSRTALPRHQTLRSLIDWSYDLLPDAERLILQRLSVFAGGWTLEAAEAICKEDGLESDEILGLLTQLVNKSLVSVDHLQSTETRYHLLETIRQYSRDKLMESGGGERIRDRQLEYFLKLAEQAEPELRGPDQVAWLDRLEDELDNMRAALEWSLESKDEITWFPEAGLRLATALLWLWHIRGRRSEGVEWLERALSVGRLEEARNYLSVIHIRLRAKGLRVAGFLALMVGDATKAKLLAEESLTLHQTLDLNDKLGLAYTVLTLAKVAGDQQDIDRMNTLTEQSLAMFREAGDKFGIAESLMGIANTSRSGGNYEQAKSIESEILTLRKDLGDQDGIATSFLGLGGLAFSQGEYKEAHAMFEESLKAFRGVGNKWMMGNALFSLGEVAWAQGNYDQAAEMLDEALALGRDSGEQYTIAGGLFETGNMARSQGNYNKGAKMLEEALALVRAVGNQTAIAAVLCDLGIVAWAQGDLEQAVQRCEEALSLSREIGGNFTIVRALYGLGKTAQTRGDLASAYEFHCEALTIQSGLRDRVGIAYSLEAFVSLAAAEQNMERTSILLGAIESLHGMIRYFLSPIERAEHDDALIAARAAVGEAAFSAAYAKGQSMSLDEAVSFALSEN